MAETDIRTLVSITTDDKGVDAARKALKSVVKEQQELTDAFKHGEKDAKQFNDEMAKLQKQEKGLEKAIDKATGEITDQNKAMKAAAKEAAALAREQERLARIEARKPKAGSAEALRQIGRDIRGLPSVRVPGIGIGTDTFGRAAEVMGRLGVTVKELAFAAGATTVAIGAVALAFKVFIADTAKIQSDMINAIVEARRNVGQDIASGLTSEEAKTRLEEINRLRAEEQKLLADTSSELENAKHSLATAWGNDAGEGSAIDPVSNFLAGLLPQTQALQSQVDESKSAIEGFNTEQQALEQALKDGALAANDAAAAEAKLAAERLAQLFTDAQQAGELATLKERVRDLTQEQIDDELKALHLRETGLKAEIAALEASGNTSEEVAKKLAALKDTLGSLADQAAVLKKARPSARSEAAEKAAKEAEKEREKAAREAEKAAAKEQREAEKQQKDRENTAKKAADEQQKFEDEMQKLRDKVNEDRIKQEIDHQREMQDIVRDFGDKRVDALEEQNFLALDKLNTEEARANRDQIIDNKRANEDITRNAETEQRHLLDEVKRASNQRLQVEAQALQQSYNNVKKWAGGITTLTADMARYFQSRLDAKYQINDPSRRQTSTQPRSR